MCNRVLVHLQAFPWPWTSWISYMFPFQISVPFHTYYPHTGPSLGVPKGHWSFLGVETQKCIMHE